MDNLDFLDGQQPATSATPEVTEPPTEAAPSGPERGPDGRFAPKATEAPQAEEPTPVAGPSEPAVPPGYVPVAALQELRKEVQALRQQSQPQFAPPDRYQDPEGFEQFQEQQRDAAIRNVRFDVSEDLARSKHGDDVVTAAQQWALEQYESTPGFYERVASHRNPYEFVVQEHQRHQLMAQLSADDLAQFKAWRAGQTSPAPAPVIAPQPPTPPRSLAAAANAGGTKPGAVPVGPGEAFNAVFKD